MKTNNNESVIGDRPPSTQAEIEAAVAAMYGQKVETMFPDHEAECDMNPYTNKCDMTPQPVQNEKIGKVDMKKSKGRKSKKGEEVNQTNVDVTECNNGISTLEKSASACWEVSSNNMDGKMYDYIDSINKKIDDACLKGCYSTNIAFIVAPNDWVNVQYLIDWYRARGFEILNYEQTSAPYGKNAGTIEYHFMISWATAKQF